MNLDFFIIEQLKKLDQGNFQNKPKIFEKEQGSKSEKNNSFLSDVCTRWILTYS